MKDNISRLYYFKDIHKGKRAFIIGTGPSLLISDLDRLKNEITFGCNKIYLAFDETDWRPTYYSVIDRMVAKNNCEAIQKLNLIKIFSSVVKPYFKNVEDIIWLTDLVSPTVNGRRKFIFSKDVVEGTYGGFTVIYTQLQIAYFMGLKEIYLIGIDFKFNKAKDTGERTQVGEVLLKNAGEVNHFHADYRGKNELWTFPKLDYQYEAFLTAKKAFTESRGIIYNASRKTELDVFPLIDLDSVI
ncbi:MAG: 6-hydroxymethylpterin diphosphokinase MptE-like protein [Promethearchaeota archaeon]